MVKDIVCGREVDQTSALNTKYGDRDFYFCSKICEMDFVGNPLKFVDRSNAAASNVDQMKVAEERLARMNCSVTPKVGPCNPKLDRELF